MQANAKSTVCQEFLNVLLIWEKSTVCDQPTSLRGIQGPAMLEFRHNVNILEFVMAEMDNSSRNDGRHLIK